MNFLKVRSSYFRLYKNIKGGRFLVILNYHKYDPSKAYFRTRNRNYLPHSLPLTL